MQIGPMETAHRRSIGRRQRHQPPTRRLTLPGPQPPDRVTAESPDHIAQTDRVQRGESVAEQRQPSPYPTGFVALFVDDDIMPIRLQPGGRNQATDSRSDDRNPHTSRRPAHHFSTVASRAICHRDELLTCAARSGEWLTVPPPCHRGGGTR